MLWRDRRVSGNLEDRRGFGAKTLGGGGLIIGAVLVWLMGGDPLVYLATKAGNVGSPGPAVNQPRDDERKNFVGVVLADTEDVWNETLRRASEGYQAPKLVLFRGQVSSACGRASSATGPFYCPGDRKIYMDLSFLDDLSGRLGAKGDFAAAYVVAHEVGHHVQALLGLNRAGGGNQASVEVELQADCLAGMWAGQAEKTKGVVEAGDIDEALGAAAAVGDDRLQKQARGYVVPDSFTHGTSAQRVAAFKQGYAGGGLSACVSSDQRQSAAF